MRRTVLAGVAGLTVSLLVATTAGAAVQGPVRASRLSPFAPDCNGAPQTGTNYPNTEIEPYVGVDPTRPNTVVGVWQQDRWSDGGANGVLARRSTDGGRTWRDVANPPFTRCAGGNAGNGGDYERATDPWITFAPNGDSYFNALSINSSDPTNAVVVSRSRDGGRTWGPVQTLIRDTDPRAFNDKNSITADPTSSRRVYAVWDRLLLPDPTHPSLFGPTYLARTTDGGASWEPARAIFDPGPDSQTIGNVVSVLPDGTLINSFDLIIRGVLFVALIRSTDHGRTWTSRPVVISPLGTIGVVDPRDGAPVRTGDIVPVVTVDPRPHQRNVYAVWQDARFSGGRVDQVAFSRSADGGLTWSPPSRISSPADVQAFTPAISVNDRGEIAVTYHDFTYDTTASTELATDVWVTRSDDGGRTFSRRERVTQRSFDMRAAPDAGGFFVGDYTGLAARRHDFAALFVAADNGDPVNATDALYVGVSGPGDRAADVAAAGTDARRSTRTPGVLSVGSAVRRR
jgi:hypothetical protein